MTEIPDDRPTSPETPGSKRPPAPARRAVARRATPGQWFDVSVRLSDAQARAFKAMGKRGCFRYGPLPGNPTAEDLSADELEMLVFDVGLEVGLVQHPRAVNVLSAHSGAADAMWIGKYAASIWYPSEDHIFLDLEDVSGSTVDQVTAYCVDWARACIQLGFRAGLYVGFDAVLGPQALYELPGFDCYWSDAAGRRVNVRGCAVRQRAQVPATAGLPNYDPDELAPDALGGLPIVAAAA